MPAHFLTHVASTFRRGTARPAGLLAALLVGLLFAGVIGWYIWNAPKAPVTVDPRIADLDNIPDLGTPTPSGRNQFERMGSNTGPFMQFADRKDPGRVAGEITAIKAEPLANQRYRLDHPRAWNFLRDGRTLYIEGDAARAHFPERTAGGRPEEANIEGNVVIKLFERRADGTRPDPEKDKPLYTARTESLRFDGALGRIHAPGKLSIDGELGRFSGSGLTLLFSEIAERIELLHIDSTEFIEIVPRKQAVTAGGPAPLSAPASGGSHVRIVSASFTPTRIPQPASEPQVVEYHLTAVDDVIIRQEGGTLTGQDFTAWVRLIDNELPARTELSPARPRRTSPPVDAPIAPRPAGGGDEVPAPVATEPEPASPFDEPPAPSVKTSPSTRDGPVRITFNGPLEMKPVKSTPNELKSNDVFVRLTAPTPRGVTAVDTASGAKAFGTLLEYGATRRDVALGAGEPMGAELQLGDRGSLRGQRVEVSLTSGLARVNGAGEIARSVSEGTDPQSIEWSDSAEFTFDLRDGEMTSLLRKAILIGKVRAIGSSQAGFYAEQCQADFAVHETSSTLSRLFLSGKAMGHDGKDGMLTANSVDVRFVAGRDAKSAIPLRMLARGDVIASQSGNQLQTAEMDADLTTNELGDSVVSRVQGRGGVNFENTDGVRAVSERMDADPVARIVDLTGVDSRVSRGDSVINGSRIRVFGERRRMEVPTPGTFSHREVTKDGRIVTAEARWWQSMTFDDEAGEVECRGQTFAELVEGDVERNQLNSEIVKIKLAPETAPTHEPDQDDGDPFAVSGSRAVEKVEALGDAGRGLVAKVETRRYQQGSPAGAEKVLERLVYLEGMHLIADSLANTLSVPGPGKLLAVDRRPQTGQQGDTTDNQGARGGLDEEGARGDALFRWQGDMLMNRADGHMSMRDRVRMDHRRLADGSKIELECQDLSAQLSRASDAQATEADQLEEVVALQRVWMRTAGRELTGGEVRYHAPTSTVTASGEAGQNVTLIETRTGSPFSARWLSWNLVTDRFEALDTQPIIVPRR